jgi:hypothetical protein
VAVAGSGAPAGIRWWLGAGEHEQVLGKLSRGLMGVMGDRWRLPTAASSSPEGRSGAAVVIGLRVRTAKEKRWKWLLCCLLVLVGRRGREEKLMRARNTAATMWRPAEARVVVARAKQDSREGKQDRDRGE